MPGKRQFDSSDFVTPTTLLREVTAADTDTPAGVEAIAEVIELDMPESNGVAKILQGKSTQLNLGIILTGDASSVTVKVYQDMGLSAEDEAAAITATKLAAPLADARWALLHTESSINGSTVIRFVDIPATATKVIVSAVTVSSGSVVVTYQRSE